MEDPIVNTIGHIGCWQTYICIVIFAMKFPVAWHQLANIFLAPPLKVKCHIPRHIDKCSSDCKERMFDPRIFKSTIVSEWDLVCDNKHLANLSQTIFMFGILIGNIVFGIWSDKIGRRIPLVFTVIMQLVCGVGAAFSPWFWGFCLMRFLTGVATGGSMLTSFVLIMEIIGPEKRELMSILFQIPFNLGHCTLPVFSYYLRDWRHFQFALSITSVIYLSYICLIPESPRWLFTTGKLDEAAAVLEKACICNKKPVENIRATLEDAKKKQDATKVDPTQDHKGSISDLFRYPNLRMKTIAMSFSWFACGATFFGVSQFIGSISGDIFTNVAITGAMCIPGTLAAIPMSKYLGRKITLVLANALPAICLIIIAFLPKSSSNVKVYLAGVGLAGMMTLFSVVYLYWAELLPTVLRNAGMGFGSMVARIGAMIAPHINATAEIADWLPPVIFGMIPIMGAILGLMLPETRGQPLPETIEDSENFGKKPKK